MANSYDPQVLRKLQLCELEILKDFIEVCEKNNLVYFGFWGTGIGALRHGGFIPWDDDIDLAMPREDYKKAMAIFERDFSDKYTVVSAEKYDDYPVLNTHIIINDSAFITAPEKHLKYPNGIFLDIFPLDYTSQDEAERLKQLKKLWFYSKLLILKHVPFPPLPIRGFKAKLVHCVTAAAWLFLNVFCISHKFLYNLCIKESTRFNDSDTGVYTYGGGTSIGKNLFYKDKIFPLKKIPYENTEILFPNNIEEALTRVYGDFMQIPPVEKQINHCPDVLTFPSEETEKITKS